MFYIKSKTLYHQKNNNKIKQNKKKKYLKKGKNEEIKEKGKNKRKIIILAPILCT